MTVWVTGEPTELEQTVRQRFPSSRICIKGRARYSEAELERVRARADQLLAAGGVVSSASSLDVTKNSVVYEAEVIDGKTMAALRKELGDAVVVKAFIELPQNVLADLPAPAPRGAVLLVTAKLRRNGGMAALGRFTVHYDASLACVCLKDGAGARILPVWPFGYWAQRDPLRVFDYDGRLIAREGEALELGGGQVEIRHVSTSNQCGSNVAWITAGG